MESSDGLLDLFLIDENIPKNLAWAIEASMSGFNCMKKYF
jgi:hypothetical protein